MATVIYIAPASGYTYAPQSRIYRAHFDGEAPRSIRDHYRTNPDAWKEVGLMNFSGKLVHFAGPIEQRQDLLDCQPLMAGLTLTYDTEDAHGH